MLEGLDVQARGVPGASPAAFAGTAQPLQERSKPNESLAENPLTLSFSVAVLAAARLALTAESAAAARTFRLVRSAV